MLQFYRIKVLHLSYKNLKKQCIVFTQIIKSIETKYSIVRMKLAKSY